MSKDDRVQGGGQHYFRTPDGAVYGPVDIATLCTWATDARVIPGCSLSADQATWFPVETVPELRLNWSVRLPDGTVYGPLNLLAIWLLASEQSIPRGVGLVDSTTGQTRVLDDSLVPLLIEECRQVLAGCGVLMGQTLDSLRKESRTLAAARDASLSDLRSQLERAEGDLAANLKLVAESQRRLAEGEAKAAQVDEFSRRVETLQSELDMLREERLRDQASRDDLTRQLEEAKARMTGMEAETNSVRQALSAERERAHRETSDVANLNAELEKMAASLQEALSGRAAAEERVRQQEDALALLRAESAKEKDDWQGRYAALEKEKAEERQKVETISAQLSEARTEVVKAQKAGRVAEQKLQDEMAIVQRDLNNMMLASRCVKQVAGLIKPKPTPIDWMNAPSGDTEENANDLEARFDRLTLNEKLVVLQKELQASAEEKNLLRQDLETLKGRYEFLQKETLRKEQESRERLAQIQKEIKTSSDLLAQTMQEVEKRESQLRLLRKKSGERGREPGKRPVLDAEVIHTEVLGPEEGASVPDAGGAGQPGPVAETGMAPRGGGILNSVEAQLKAELSKWETLKQEKENKKGTFSKWFRRK